MSQGSLIQVPVDLGSIAVPRYLPFPFSGRKFASIIYVWSMGPSRGGHSRVISSSSASLITGGESSINKKQTV